MITRQYHRSGRMFDTSECCGLHPSFSDEVNRNDVRTEIEGGVSQDVLPIGAKLEVRTQNHVYDIENREDGRFIIAGHPEYCPTPVLVKLHGSTWGGSMIRLAYIGRGMCLEFHHPDHGVILTSAIEEITERPASGRDAKR